MAEFPLKDSNKSKEFPNIGVPDRDKNKDYHERFVRAIVGNTFNNNWATNYNVLKALYQFYNDGTDGGLTSYLQQAPDGSQMPGLWISLNTAKTKITNLLGELEERSYLIKAYAVNSEAFARKLEEKERLRIARKLQPIAKFNEQLTGIPLQRDEYIPQSEAELDEYMDLSWKDKHVLILEMALKWIAETTEWDEKRKALLRDIFIAGRSIVVNEVLNCVPQARRVDPLKFIFDPNATDDMLSDSTYFGEVEYMPLAAAAERYGLSLEEIKNAYNSYNEYLGMGANRPTSSYHDAFGAMPGQTLQWFKTEDGSPRCLVLRACWRDYKTLSHKYVKDEEYGSEHLKDVSDEPIRKRDRDKIISNKIECWRQGTLIGGTILKEWGECPNQPRDLNKLHKSEPPYKVWIPDFLLGKSVSKLEQLVGLQTLKDISMYQIQVQMARSIGKVLVLDEAMLPEGMTRESAMSHIKADGIAWVNSKEYQLGTGNMNLFKDFDLSLSESIMQSIQIIQYCDSQMDAVSGVTGERTGQVQGASTAVGVQQAALFQSNLNTAPYFKGFERFCTRVLNHQAKLVKIVWPEKKEVFAPIIGDVGVDFLKDNIDISLDEFDVRIKSLPPSTLDRQKLEQLLMIAVQSDPEFLDDAFAIMMEPDTTIAIRKYQRKRALRKMRQAQQEQMMAQQEQMMQEQQLALQERELEFQEANAPIEIQRLKGQDNLQKTLATGRVKLAGEKLKLLNL